VKKFSKRRGVLTTHFSGYEVELLTSLILQLVELVSDGKPEEYLSRAPDAFDELVRDLEGERVAEPDDPVLRRLFPNAYPHDPSSAADFRRFTERGLRSKKITDAAVVLRGLAETAQGANPLRIPLTEAESWLRTLTSVRLAVATRLGITDAAAADALADLPEDDPRSFLASIYDWLGFAEETLISAM
jgi:Domain of unknown function (DUF2017)